MGGCREVQEQEQEQFFANSKNDLKRHAHTLQGGALDLGIIFNINTGSNRAALCMLCRVWIGEWRGGRMMRRRGFICD